MKRTIIIKGGPGSGHHGHAGRPGKRGGSSPGKGTNAESKRRVAVASAMSDAERAAEIARLQKLASEKIDNLSPEDKARYLEAKTRMDTIFATGQTTDKLYTDDDGNWDEDRAKLHQEIVDDIFANSAAKPVDGTPEAVVTGGVPGAGKSTTLNAVGLELDNHIHLDSDAIKARLGADGRIPPYEGWNAGQFHEESSYVLSLAMARAIDGNYNLVYDATLKTASTSVDIVGAMEAVGYRTKVTFTDVPVSVAMDRALSRYLGPNGRFVPLEYLATHDSKNLNTLGNLQGIVDEWHHYDNNVPYGSDPILLGSGGG